MRARRSYLAATLVVLTGTLAACGGGEEPSSGPTVLTVYVSLPLSGPAAADGRDAADGARLALADAGAEAGGAQVEARFLDAGAAGSGWSPARSAANARTATRDSTATAYVGDFQSGATRASLPITNQAFMLHVSPASGAGDLVAEFPGSDEISELQTNDERNFGRVIPSDEQQAAAAAGWVAELSARPSAALTDGSEFGEAMVDAFQSAQRQLAFDGRLRDLAYYAGRPGSAPVREGFEAIVVSDAELSPFAAQLPPRYPDGTFATSAALDPTHLSPAGEDFADRFADEYGRRPGRYAAYGYEAMAVALDSIDRAGDPANRREVVDAFFETAGRDSVLGEYSITDEGETTLGRLSGYEIRAGEARPVAELEVP